MRGRKAGDHRLLPSAAPPQAAVIGPCPSAWPVTPEELDVIEAFLMPEILRLLELSADSKAPERAETIEETIGAIP